MFDAADVGLRALGAMVDEALLQSWLYQLVLADASIEVVNASVSAVASDKGQVQCDTGAMIEAGLVIGADGAHSLVRSALVFLLIRLIINNQGWWPRCVMKKHTTTVCTNGFCRQGQWHSWPWPMRMRVRWCGHILLSKRKLGFRARHKRWLGTDAAHAVNFRLLFDC